MRTVLEERLDPVERHVAAVRGSFRWAQESADRGDHADALDWIRVLEAIGEEIPPSYKAKRRAWEDQLTVSRAEPGRSR